MGWRFRKSIRLGRGVRLNLGTRSLGISFGTRGARLSVGTRGITTSVGIPGTGLYYTRTFSGRRRSRALGEGAERPGSLGMVSAVAAGVVLLAVVAFLASVARW